MNRLCTLLGIERPVIQSPMAGFQGFELAAAGPQSLPAALTAACTGRPARGLVHRWIEDSARVAAAVPLFPLAAGKPAPMRAAALVETPAAGRPTQEAPAP